MSETDVCLKHSGICARVKALEDDVRSLWDKWDSVQKLLVGTLVSTTLSLMGVIFLLLRLK